MQRETMMLRTYNDHRRAEGSIGIKLHDVQLSAQWRRMRGIRDVEPGPIAEIAFVIKQKWVNAAHRDPCIRNRR